MNATLLVLAALASLQGATPAAKGTSSLRLAGGFSVLRVDLPGLPVIPLLRGELELAHGLTDWLDLRARYATDLGVIHRLGPELRACVVGSDRWTLGLRLYPSVQVGGTAQDEVTYAGDVSTQAGLLGSWHLALGTITAEVGSSVEWLVFEQLDGGGIVDSVPYIAFTDLALGFEWRAGETSSYGVRLELRIPTAPDDPFTVLGGYPRLLFGSSFQL